MRQFFNRFRSHAQSDGNPKIDLYNSWVNAKADITGCPGIYRLNLGLKDWINRAPYLHEAVISIEIENTAPNGLPLNKKEWEALSTIEHTLVPRLHQKLHSLLGLIVTTDGFQDLIFYSSAPETLANEVKSAEPRVDRSLQLRIEQNGWLHYKKFTQALAEREDTDRK